MIEDPRPIVYLDGAWTEIDAPTASELEIMRCSPGLFSDARLAEIEAWTEQVRMALSVNDRRFLRSLRIQGWETTT